MRRLQLRPNYGKHCFVVPLEGDPSKVVKVFNYRESNHWRDLDTFRWGDPPTDGGPNMSVSLLDATKIQNIAAMYGLAPHVYEIVEVQLGCRYCWGQVQDAVVISANTNQAEADAVYREVVKLGQEYGFITEKEDVSVFDVSQDGKLVDFNTFHFVKNYQELWKKKYTEMALYGKKYYHNVEEWGLTDGPRDNQARVQWLGLDTIDFTKKSVLDIGCASGWFTRYAYKQGASDVVGIDSRLDLPGSDIIRAAKLVANDLQMWNIRYWDFHLADVATEELNLNFKQWDIVLFLSMTYHLGIPKWLPLITSSDGICIVEDNSKERNAEVQLKKLFPRVELHGYTEDRGNSHLPIYYCYLS